ncbi:hypothetical protein [Paradevosia shaoguanensis]|uniref:Uncharacterized protein n=1 Tax=Paradevosia shaoguanensis TaxID=1335043 RepID=A0AA41QKX4_9HYPH|nr:hypothetical protein [Paradevosia shaoguanensis]MCF1741594.1 hypothetical protein [Paradevosia shaoguanensis]MCI0126077.1 hypothetical protein [Paradevosia shaoguanensis]
MRNVNTGRRPAFTAVTRAGLVSAVLLVGAALSACTTVEGTNALTDAGTFEREVMTSTLQGLSLVPKGEGKSETIEARGPLVMPKAGSVAPAPQQSVKTAMLPVDSSKVQIDATNLSEADIQRLRNARVVDLRSLSGRPLTDAEARQLTARMNAANMATTANTKRPLYYPPDEYFTTVGGRDLVCATPSGELVRIDDNRCPPAIRKALQSRGVKGPASSGMSDPFSSLSNDLGLSNN